MDNHNRILGKIVGAVLSKEDLEFISGGDGPIVCNGCQVSTSTHGVNGEGCKCDN